VSVVKEDESITKYILYLSNIIQGGPKK